MVSGNSFHTITIATSRVSDDFCGGIFLFSMPLVVLDYCGQANRPPVNGSSRPSISMAIWTFVALDTALKHISPIDVLPVMQSNLLQDEPQGSRKAILAQKPILASGNPVQKSLDCLRMTSLSSIGRPGVLHSKKEKQLPR
jgi:hypothetical protein